LTNRVVGVDRCRDGLADFDPEVIAAANHGKAAVYPLRKRAGGAAAR